MGGFTAGLAVRQSSQRPNTSPQVATILPVMLTREHVISPACPLNWKRHWACFSSFLPFLPPDGACCFSGFLTASCFWVCSCCSGTSCAGTFLPQSLTPRAKLRIISTALSPRAARPLCGGRGSPIKDTLPEWTGEPAHAIIKLGKSHGMGRWSACHATPYPERHHDVVHDDDGWREKKRGLIQEGGKVPKSAQCVPPPASRRVPPLRRWRTRFQQASVHQPSERLSHVLLLTILTQRSSRPAPR